MSGTGKRRLVAEVIPIHDPLTGEHIGDGHVERDIAQGRPRIKARREPFMMLTQRSMAKLDLTTAQWRVLMFLGSRRDRTTMESRVLVREIANALGMQQPNVSRVLIDLQKRDVIYKLGTGVYRINNHIAYMGDQTATQVAADPEPEWERHGQTS